jgi:hypothetical protein
LHALLVVDTRSGLGDSVLIDGERMRHLLISGIPQDRLELTIFKAKDVTAAKILAYYKTHKVDSSDALLFYYAGHGAIDPQKGHFLALQELNTKPLLRSTLRAAMRQHAPGLVVIVTDCCSDRFKIPNPPKKKFRGSPPSEIDPVLRCLFFQHRGVVDITAATDNAAFGDDHDGGLFTRSLVAELKKSAHLLDASKDGFVSWSEVFPRVQADTQRAFARWAREARSRGESVDQATQKPRAFALGARGQSLTLINGTKRPVRYQHRWEGDAAWETTILPAEGSQTHTAPTTKLGKEMPRLEVRFESGETAVLKVGKSYKYSDDKKSRSVPDE